MDRTGRHIDLADRARRRRLVGRLTIGAATLLSVVIVGFVGTMVADADSRPGRPAATGAGPPGSATTGSTPSGDPAGARSATAASPSVTPPTTTHPASTPAPHPTARTPTPMTAAPAGSNPSYEAQVVTLVNQERAKVGCRALRVDSRLTAAARAHSQDMAARGYFDHNTPEGVTPWARITDAGYAYSRAAENIARGQASPQAVMQAWMNSEGHRENILDCALRDIGVGVADDSAQIVYWTQDFGTPA